jgi:hypothetical protein
MASSCPDLAPVCTDRTDDSAQGRRSVRRGHVVAEQDPELVVRTIRDLLDR